jgi:3-hydroxyisobutyrate dehydrogenase
MRIAFIGLGNMGGGMAANLAAAGNEVRAFDLSPDALARASEIGCATFGSVEEAVEGAEVVVSMLPNGAIVKDVYTNHVIGRARSDAILLDCSTIAVDDAREVERLAAEAGYAMVDAPVSGGIAAAAAGTLTFMVGGSDEAFARAKEVLGPMGKAVIHAGSAGAGQAAKICNTMMLGIHMIGTCEGFAMAQKLGLDPQVFFDIASKASGQSWSMTSYTPVPGVGPDTPADHDYDGGFAAALMLKDLKLAMNAAQHAGAYTPLGAQAEELYQRFVNLGGGSKDFSGIIKMLDDSWKAPPQE